MPMEDRFPPSQPLPLFLSGMADDEPEQSDTGIARNGAVSSRILKMNILVVAATAIGFAILGGANPVAFVANITASLVDLSVFQSGTAPSTPAVKPIADAQVSPPTASEVSPLSPDLAPPLDKTALLPPTSRSATDAPPHNEVAAAVEPADQSQTEIGQPSTDALFKQYQAWRAERAKIPPAQDNPTVARDARPQGRPIITHRRTQPDQNARAEIRPVQSSRRSARPEQNTQTQIPPAQGTATQDPPVQDAQAPSLLQIFGSHN
jgi:hypothetical protein